MAASGLSCGTWEFHCSMQDLHCSMRDLSLRHVGFSSCIARASLSLCCTGSRACRLSCPAVCGILVPWPGIEPRLLALEGGFLTTGPPGKSHKSFIWTQPYPFVRYFLWLLSCYNDNSYVVVTEMIWSAKPKIFINWLFTVEVCWPLI